MASKIEHLDNSMVRITVDVPQDDFKEALNKAFRKNAKRFSVPGFRKGKAPMKIVTNYYGEGVLYDDAIDFAAQPAYEAALAELELKPFSRPQINIESIGSDKGMVFTCEFAVRPDVQLGEYQGVTAYRPDDQVADDAIDQEIERARERVSRMVPVTDRAVEDGDTVNIDYRGLLNGEVFEGGEAAHYDLKIGSKTFIPGFEEKLIGHEAGEEFAIDLTFPEEYHAEELKGQDVVFEVKINEIKTRELPELDDEFVKDVSEDCDTVEEYRESIRERLSQNAKERADGVFMDHAVAEAVKNATFELPHVVIHEEMERMYQEQARQMSYQGFKIEDYLGYLGIDKNTFMMQLHDPAEQRVRTELVLEAIAKAENIEVTDEDIDAQIEKMAGLYGNNVEDLKKSFASEESREYLKNDIVRNKTMEWIKDHAIATDVEPEPEHDHDHGHDCACGDEHCDCDHEHPHENESAAQAKDQEEA